MVTSFVICVVNRLFRSVWLFMAMCVMELFLVYIGVQVVVEAVIGTKDIFGILFMVVFVLSQLVAFVLVVIDMVIRIMRCCRANKTSDNDKEAKTATKLRRDLGEEDYFGLD